MNLNSINYLIDVKYAIILKYTKKKIVKEKLFLQSRLCDLM